MIITWHGNSCFSIQQKTEGEGSTLLFNPSDRTSRARTLEERADVIVEQNPELPASFGRLRIPSTAEGSPKEGGKLLIQESGEYEMKKFCIRAIPFLSADGLWHMMVRVIAEEITVVHLDDAVPERLSDEELETLGEIDILLLPFGLYLSASEAATWVQKLEPRMLIPAPHERILEKGGKAQSAFLKELGIGVLEPSPRVNIKKKELPQEEMRVILLTPQ